MYTDWEGLAIHPRKWQFLINTVNLITKLPIFALDIVRRRHIQIGFNKSLGLKRLDTVFRPNKKL